MDKTIIYIVEAKNKGCDQELKNTSKGGLEREKECQKMAGSRRYKGKEKGELKVNCLYSIELMGI